MSQDKDEAYRKRPRTTRRDIHDEDEVESHSSIIDIPIQIRTDSLYRNRSAALHSLPERIRKGAKFAVQPMEYVRLMEDRVGDMEERLRLIENKGVEPEPSAPPVGRMNQHADTVMDIKRMTFPEYLPTDLRAEDIKITESTPFKHKRRYEFPGQSPCHLIDVVVSNRNQPNWLSKDQMTKSAAGSDLTAPGSIDTDQGPMAYGVPSVQPERMRINSSLMLRVLAKITNAQFTSSRVSKEVALQDQVILRPFKLFLYFEQEIRDEINLLEIKQMSDSDESKPLATKTAKHGDQSPPSTHLNDENPRNASIDASMSEYDKETNPLESRQCLKELGVLKEFLDKDLKRTFDLRLQIKDGSVRSITFQDLWHLFTIGSETVSNGGNGQSQTYRILNVTGRRAFLCSRSDLSVNAVDPLSSGR